MKQHPFVRSVEKTIRDFNMLRSGDTVLMAVSGGPDSVALLHTMLTLQTEFDIRLGVAHLNHGLRPSAAVTDAGFVSSLCQKKGLRYHAEKRDLRARHHRQKGSLEALARQVRYDFLSRVAQKIGYNKIALGHHAADNAELILMNLFRGSGPLGLSGIPPVRDNRFIRPLIGQSREQIMTFLQEYQLDFTLDETNQDTRFLRNRIRHELLPDLIRHYNPNLVDTLNRTADILRAEEELLEQTAQQALDSMSDMHNRAVRVSISKLLENHVALQRRILRVAIGRVKGDLRKMTLQHIDAVLNLCRQGSSGQQLCLPDKVTVQILPKRLLAVHKSLAMPDSRMHSHGHDPLPLYNLVLPRPGMGVQKVAIKELKTTLIFRCMPVESIANPTSAGQDTAFFDMDQLTSPLSLRYNLPGDRFMPLGMRGTQKLKNYFIDHKIPRDKRPTIPVLLSNNRIVWIVGHRIDERAKITQQTRNVLKIEVFLA